MRSSAGVAAGLGAVLLLGSLACASPVPPARVEGMLAHAVAAARAHHAQGREAEAAELLRPVQRLDPGREEAEALAARVGEASPALFEHPWLGVNFARRPPVERSPAARVLLFLPDRVLDLADVLSFDLHLGFGAFANLHATRAVQLGGGVRTVGGVGWHESRSLGVRNLSESGLVALGLGPTALGVFRAGTSGLHGASHGVAGAHRPDLPLYRETRDYWELGVDLTLAVLGADVGFHPVELADAVLGWGGLDLLNDDWARTRNLALTDEEEALVRSLQAVEGSPRAREAWEQHRDERSPP